MKHPGNFNPAPLSRGKHPIVKLRVKQISADSSISELTEASAGSMVVTGCWTDWLLTSESKKKNNNRCTTTLSSPTEAINFFLFAVYCLLTFSTPPSLPFFSSGGCFLTWLVVVVTNPLVLGDNYPETQRTKMLSESCNLQWNIHFSLAPVFFPDLFRLLLSCVTNSSPHSPSFSVVSYSM